MCGIAGWISWHEQPHIESVRWMTDQLAHRGPDSGGVMAFPEAVLGHRRLAILDLEPQANQPFLDPEGRYALVYNGELYNFQDLRLFLKRRGINFRTHSDTEVLLESYKYWGSDCVKHFNGMFSFAIWDVFEKCLFMARDRAGEKPLYLRQLGDRGLLFASEPRALFPPELACAEPDPIGAAEYITHNYTLGSRTLYKNVTRLPAAHCMSVRLNRTSTWEYWNLAEIFQSKKFYASENEAAEALRALIDDSVRLRLISDVPLGAFLSGGIDSSTIAASMTRFLPPEKIHTFSMGFSQSSYSELQDANEVAKYFDVNHRDRLMVSDPEQILLSVVRAADEPLADTSALPMYWLSQFASERVKVVLSGDGADECFAGYETYVASKLHRMLGSSGRRALSFVESIVDRSLPVSFSKVSFDYKLRKLVAGLQEPAERAHVSWRTIFSNHELVLLMRPEWLEELKSYDPYQAFTQHFYDVEKCHPLDQFLYVDFKTWMVDDILVKTDRTTMAHSLECRAPFLDHRLVEFAASLPPDWKLKGFQKKHMLRRSMRDRLPRSVLNRRKQGFNAPVSDWFSGPLLEFATTALEDSRLDPWFQRSCIEKLLKDHLLKRRDNGLKLLGLTMFSLWLSKL